MVLGHQHPDGDALGAAAGLASILRDMGKAAVVGISGRVAPNLNFLMDPPRHFLRVDRPDPGIIAPYGLLIYVDCHGPSRVWPDSGPGDWERLPPNLVIDHHVHNEELQGALAVFHDRDASSTGELVGRLAKSVGAGLRGKAVEALLTAIASDTGFFSQDNATQWSLREAADLVAMGGSLARLHERLSSGFSLPRMRLLSLSLASLELFLGDRVAVMLLTDPMLEAASARIEDSDGFIDYPRALANVLLAALIKVDGQGGVKVSLRSRHPVSSRRIAMGFGGGGHELAAAYTDPCPSPEEARERFLSAVSSYILARGGDHWHPF
jgi:phosphoesterase RecJ-like protein